MTALRTVKMLPELRAYAYQELRRSGYTRGAAMQASGIASYAAAWALDLKVAR